MSEKNLLEIKDLHVNVEDKEILHGVIFLYLQRLRADL